MTLKELLSTLGAKPEVVQSVEQLARALISLQERLQAITESPEIRAGIEQLQLAIAACKQGTAEFIEKYPVLKDPEALKRLVELSGPPSIFVGAKPEDPPEDPPAKAPIGFRRGE